MNCRNLTKRSRPVATASGCHALRKKQNPMNAELELNKGVRRNAKTIFPWKRRKFGNTITFGKNNHA
ncbi:hypothetical protein AVEN_269708-1 [Araneus ventricosus]|uniref:Uncharacterized protein n=1 Tax=Araneus ventricosus TaxID=182803 RepID=A0A4Y2KRX6_ARAVE|nr:hypothetical protein AVEN_269708-1 [Araneus ventricosus]